MGKSSRSARWHALAVVPVVAAIVFAAPTSRADAAAPPPLFRAVAAGATADAPRRALGGSSRQELVDVDQGLLAGAAPVLAIRAFGDDIDAVAVLDHVERRGPGDLTWFGRTAGTAEASLPHGIDVVLVARAGGVAGTVFLPGHELDLVTADDAGTGVEVLTERPADRLEAPRELMVMPPEDAGDTGTAANPSAPVGVTAAAGDASAVASPTVTIDVLIVYQQVVADQLGSAVAARAQAAVDLTNVALANSQVDVRLRLVHQQQVADAELSDLDTITASPSVAALRDRWGADLVAGWGAYSGFCGIAWMNQNRSSPRYGFSLVDDACVSSLTPAHEWGHNLGAHHDRANASGPGAFPYSYGFVSVAGDFRTVMSYDSPSCPGGSCNRIPYFSNPGITYLGRATGVADSEDNARTIRAVAPIVVAYRADATPPAAAVPSAPLTVSAVAGASSASVFWTAPASDGGSPVWAYTVTSAPGGRTCAWTSGPLSCVVGGLSYGTPHTFTVTATNAVGTGAPSAPSPAVTPFEVAGDAFHPSAPVRVLDSRPSGPAAGGYTTPWGPDVTRAVTVAGVNGIPAGADAVVLNVTVTATTAGSYLTVYPAGQSRPLASSLNWVPGQTVANAVTTKVGTGGQVSVLNAAGNADVIVDVVGYYDTGPGDGYTAAAPVRVLDSRPSGPAAGGYTTPWGPDVARAVTVAGVNGIPADADAVVLNVTVTATTAGSYLTVYPAGQPRPLASSLNWVPGQTVANAVTAKVGTNRQLSVLNAAGDADVIVDVVGYYRAGTGALLHPLAPIRIQDSRPSGPATGDYTTPWGPDTTRAVTVTGLEGVPADADAVVLNATVTATTAGSYLTVYPPGPLRPLASSLNWVPGQTVANAVTARTGASPALAVYNLAGGADVILDVVGYFR
jgi:hypothetical protein